MSLPGQRTRRPIPRDPDVYLREVAGIRRYLHNLKGFEPAYGPAWVAKQRAYYTTRLADLLAHPPAGQPNKKRG